MRVPPAIAALPRFPLFDGPSPLARLPRFSAAIGGGADVWIKREDLLPLAFGGNKLRNLEFRLARTMAENPDTVVVGLDRQSNSARQTIGACNKLGLKTILVLEGQRPDVVQGNLLVDYLLGADVVFAPTRAAQRAALDEHARRVREAGGRPHILNDNPMFDVASALAYLETTLELLEQMDTAGVQPNAFYMSSSGKGQAGLVLGKRLTNAGHAVHGVTATDEFHVPSRTAAIANETLEVLGFDRRVSEDDVRNDMQFVGPGYGIPTDTCVDAVKLFARTEGVILDPIYTGKAAAGMIAHIEEGRYGKGDTLVFVHTGGTPAIFTWNKLWL
jgi:D-cysteine desulfhydrase/L-cysteate sulfo-lyase